MMDFKRENVIALYLSGKAQVDIVRALQHLKINKSFVSRTIARYHETGSVARRKGSGRKKTITTSKIIRKVKNRIDRNPRCSGRKIACEMKISQRSMRRILRDELHLKPLKLRKAHDLTDAQKEDRLDKAKELIRLIESGQLPNLVFSDEKSFKIERFMYKQNDQVYIPDKLAENLQLQLASKNQTPQMLMVWAAITADGRSPLVFIDHGIKLNAKYYQETILKGVLTPWANKHFGGKRWTFQQDSAPSHRAYINQKWLESNVPRFIPHTYWPTKSHNVNPLDFSIWRILESKVDTKKYQSVDDLKQALQHEWNEIPQSYLYAVCDGFINRLKSIVTAEGGHIELK